MNRIITGFCTEESLRFKKIILFSTALLCGGPVDRFLQPDIHRSFPFFTKSVSLNAQSISLIVLDISWISTNSQDLLLFLGSKYGIEK
jgi:hypothetical protein